MSRREHDGKLIYLARHGHVETGSSRRYVGHIDLELSDRGVEQARRLSQHLRHIRFDAIWCSDLQRSLRTAEIIAELQSVRPQARIDLREVSLGRWEGLSFDQVRADFPEEFDRRGLVIARHRPPGGESFADCARRVLAAIDEIVRMPGDNILIVGHAGVNRIILSHVLCMPLRSLFRLEQDYGCLNIIAQNQSGYRVHLMGMVV